MAKSHDILTVRDLIEALGWHTHFTGFGKAFTGHELSDYWGLRFELLSRALGLPTGWNDDRKTPRMLGSVSRQTILSGFFAGFLEYTFLAGEREIYQAHHPRIVTAEAQVRAAMIEFAEELLLTFWPQLRGENVRFEELISMGLPANQPDPDDFW